MLTSYQTGEKLDNIRMKMETASKILNEINEDYDIIRADRYDRGVRELYDSDSSLQDGLTAIRDSIMYMKHEMIKLEFEDE